MVECPFKNNEIPLSLPQLCIAKYTSLLLPWQKHKSLVSGEEKAEDLYTGKKRLSCIKTMEFRKHLPMLTPPTFFPSLASIMLAASPVHYRHRRSICGESCGIQSYPVK